MKHLRSIAVLCTLLLCVSIVFAQTGGDRLYNQGLQLQKVMTVSSQNQAIEKFKSAKKLYDSAVKKAQCDQAIQVSLGIIKKIGSDTTPTPARTQSQSTLQLSTSRFDLSASSQTVQVKVTSGQSWDVVATNGESGQFAYPTRNGNYIEIYVDPNNTYSSRSQKLMVTSGNSFKEIVINQAGQTYSSQGSSSGSYSGGDDGASSRVNNFRSQVRNYLAEEGYGATIDSDGDVKFSYGGSTFFARVKEVDNHILLEYLVGVTVPDRISDWQANRIAYGVAREKICLRAEYSASNRTIWVESFVFCTGIQMFKELFLQNIKLIDVVSDDVLDQLKEL